jgi:acyl-CoA thioesterase
VELPFLQHVGARIVGQADGTGVVALRLQPHHRNSSGLVHGGVPFTLADTAMGAALYSTLGEGERCATIEIKISYFRPITEGELVCRSRIVHRGRNTASLEAALTVGDTLVANATGTFAIVPRKPP